MKNAKRKSIIKTARKTAKKNILKNLISELKKVSAEIGTGSNKLEKVIVKGSAKLAKKVAKQIKLDKTAILANTQPATEAATAEKAETPKPSKTKIAKSKSEKEFTKALQADAVVTAS